MRPIVALMMSRDEADVVAEVVESWRAWGIPVLAIDDSSDGTYDILKSYDHVAVWRQDEFCPPGEKGSHNWVLNPLLERKRERFGPDTWVLIANADEIWYHAPPKIVAAMEAEGAETLLVAMCNYLLHPDDAANWDFAAGRWKPSVASLPLAERMPWYTAGWLEYRGFLDRDGCRLERDRGLLPAGATGPVFSRRPLVSHHSIRSPEQAVRRAADRVEREFQEAYRPYYYRRDSADVFYEGFPELGIVLERWRGDYGVHEAGLEDLR